MRTGTNGHCNVWKPHANFIHTTRPRPICSPLSYYNIMRKERLRNFSTVISTNCSSLGSNLVPNSCPTLLKIILLYWSSVVESHIIIIFYLKDTVPIFTWSSIQSASAISQHGRYFNIICIRIFNPVYAVVLTLSGIDLYGSSQILQSRMNSSRTICTWFYMVHWTVW